MWVGCGGRKSRELPWKTWAHVQAGMEQGMLNRNRSLWAPAGLWQAVPATWMAGLQSWRARALQPSRTALPECQPCPSHLGAVSPWTLIYPHPTPTGVLPRFPWHRAVDHRAVPGGARLPADTLCQGGLRRGSAQSPDAAGARRARIPGAHRVRVQVRMCVCVCARARAG